jgi:hypothetical protein
MIASLKGWRTVALNAFVSLVSLVALVAAYLDAANIASYLPPQYAWITLALGVANIVLRRLTTTPLGQKQ